MDICILYFEVPQLILARCSDSQKRVVRGMLAYSDIVQTAIQEVVNTTITLLFIAFNNGSLFITNNDIYCAMQTRSSNLLRIPTHKTFLYEHEPQYRSAKAFNILTLDLKAVRSLGSFKAFVKQYFLYNVLVYLLQIFVSIYSDNGVSC